jgi:flagellar protein FlaF
MANVAQTCVVVAGQSNDPRALEADLLLKAAARLQTIHDSWETHDSWDTRRSELDDTLQYNRQLWMIFVTSATSNEHPLPVDIRQNVANLALFVTHQTVAMLQEPKRAQIADLININRELAAGLLGQ